MREQAGYAEKRAAASLVREKGLAKAAAKKVRLTLASAANSTSGTNQTGSGNAV